MIGFLRFIGVMNAAVWLGGAVFFAVAVRPAMLSPEMAQALQGTPHFPYFSEAMSQVALTRYFNFHIVCAAVALLHLLGEWIYLGRPGRKFSLTLLLALLALALAGKYAMQPPISKFLNTRYFSAVAAERSSAATSFKAWSTASHILHFVAIAGLGIYLWRVSNPPDTTRFISSVKFRD